jgi:CheY-like chemotaxis protein
MGIELAPVKILIVDDDRSTRILLRSLLVKLGHTVVEASNGREAIEVFQAEHPGMVITDVGMPEMGGHELAVTITQKLATRFVPIIFLTALHDDKALVECIESGGDDFISKPFNPILLQAKVTAMNRIRLLHDTLEEYRSNTEDELRLARHVFSTITLRMKEFIPGLGYWTQAAGHLPGDLILYDTTPSGQIYAMVADFTGHGLAAAVGAIPVADIFFALTRKDFKLEDIIVEINRKLRQIFPVGHFCAAAFVSSDPASGQLKVWNAGLPAAFLINQQREVVQRFTSKNLALGIIDINAGDVVLVESPDALGGKLVMYTDGLTEVNNKAGEVFGEEKLIELIHKTAGKPLFDTLKGNVVDFIHGTKPHDDISLLVLPIQYSNDLDIWPEAGT